VCVTKLFQPQEQYLLLYCLHNDVVCSSDYAASYGMMIDEYERMRKEVIVVYFKVLSRHSSGDSEKRTRNLSQNNRR
jgi:hypothetical protein